MKISYQNLAILFFVLVIINRLFLRKKNLPPSPPALPIIGHLHLLKKPFLYQALEDLLSQYGPVLFLKFGSKRALVVSSPSAVEECFTKNDIIFANRPRTMAGDHFTYNSTSIAWAPYGPQWRTLRRLIVSEVLSSKSMQKFCIIREEEVRCLLRRLFKASSAGGGVQKVDIKFSLCLLMTNIMMRVLVGKRCVEEHLVDTEAGKQLFQEFKELFLPTLGMNLCDFVPVLKLIGYKGIEKSMIKLQSRRDKFLQNLIVEARSNRSRSSETTNNIIDKKEDNSLIETLLLLQESEPESYSDEIIKSILMIMITAGTETTATTSEWAMAHLLSHPQELDKVKAEIDTHVGNDQLLKESDIVKLPGLRNVISETLRLYPPTPLLLPHFSSQSCRVGGYDIPKGTMLLVNVMAMQRDPKLWEKPNEFIPERFETVPETTCEGLAYAPFGMGRRICPGAGVGTHMVALTLGSLIQCFECNKAEPVIDMSLASTSGSAMQKAKPLKAMCCPRQDMLQILSQV